MNFKNYGFIKGVVSVNFTTNIKKENLETLIKIILYQNTLLKFIYTKIGIKKFYFVIVLFFITSFIFSAMEIKKVGGHSLLSFIKYASVLGIIAIFSVYVVLKLIKAKFLKVFLLYANKESAIRISKMGISSLVLGEVNMSVSWNNIERIVISKDLCVCFTKFGVIIFFKKNDLGSIEDFKRYIKVFFDEDRVFLLENL